MYEKITESGMELEVRIRDTQMTLDEHGPDKQWGSWIYTVSLNHTAILSSIKGKREKREEVKCVNVSNVR